LCGYHWAGCKALELLLNQFDEVFVYTHEAAFPVPDLISLCKSLGVKYTTEKIDVSNLPFEVDLIASIYYRNIIKEDVIEKVNGKIFNLHPSLLPMYRGCSSLTWAIINGEQETGYTYHYIDKGCDTGNIILQERLKIEVWDTQQSLYQRAMFEAMKKFEEVVDAVLIGVEGIIQKGAESYYSRGCPHDGEISSDWSDKYISNYIRAMINPPLPVAKFKGNDIFSMDQFKRIME